MRATHLLPASRFHFRSRAVFTNRVWGGTRGRLSFLAFMKMPSTGHGAREGAREGTRLMICLMSGAPLGCL